MSDFQQLISKRRSVYQIGVSVQETEPEITEMIKACLYEAPSAFNSQSTRLVLLYGNAYQSFWCMVHDTLEKIVPQDKFDLTQQRIKSFAAGIGTILYFEDMDVIAELQNQMPTYADSFPIWAEHSNAMVQYMIWVALAEKGLGASLQHYNPLIDDKTRSMFELPRSWQLIAQMPFGQIVQKPQEKTHLPLDSRLKIFR